MGKVEFIEIKKVLGRTNEEKEELKNKAEEISKKNEERIEEKVKQGKIVKANTMTDEEKKIASLEYFNNNYIIDQSSQIPAIEAFNQMREETNLKILSSKFLQYLREDNKTLEKKDKYYIIGYKRKT